MFNKNDIVIHDRGYFSYMVLYNLHKLNVYPIFRMKKSNQYVKQLLKSKSYDKTYTVYYDDNTKIKLRIIKYTIDNETYYIGTTLLETNFTIDVLKDLYKKRWSIEEYFKFIKYSMSFKDFHSKSEKLIKQEIYVHNICIILTRTLEEMYKKYYKPNMEDKNSNFKNNVDKVVNKILINILYGSNSNWNKINRVLKILFNYLIKIINNRVYNRISITPPSKWYCIKGVSNAS